MSAVSQNCCSAHQLCTPCCPPGIKKNISQRRAGPRCKRLVSTNCQIKRSERMIQPTFSRISSKLLRSMFGSTLWHPEERNTSDTQTRHVRKNKNRLICWIFTVYNQHHGASLHVAAGELRRGWPFCHWKRKLSI